MAADATGFLNAINSIHPPVAGFYSELSYYTYVATVQHVADLFFKHGILFDDSSYRTRLDVLPNHGSVFCPQIPTWQRQGFPFVLTDPNQNHVQQLPFAQARYRDFHQTFSGVKNQQGISFLPVNQRENTSGRYHSSNYPSGQFTGNLSPQLIGEKTPTDESFRTFSFASTIDDSNVSTPTTVTSNYNSDRENVVSDSTLNSGGVLLSDSSASAGSGAKKRKRRRRKSKTGNLNLKSIIDNGVGTSTVNSSCVYGSYNCNIHSGLVISKNKEPVYGNNSLHCRIDGSNLRSGVASSTKCGAQKATTGSSVDNTGSVDRSSLDFSPLPSNSSDVPCGLNIDTRLDYRKLAKKTLWERRCVENQMAINQAKKTLSSPHANTHNYELYRANEKVRELSKTLREVRKEKAMLIQEMTRNRR